MKISQILQGRSWLVCGLTLSLLMGGCSQEQHPYQLYKAYYADHLRDLELIDQAGDERGVADFDVDYASLPDFSTIEDTRARKQAFFDYLRPAVEYRNEVNRERRLLLGAVRLKLEHGLELDYPETLFLANMRSYYKVPEETSDLDALDVLDRRLDVIPPSLALAQAAIESGWGRSRFAREANNLFGQWCFEAGCGVVPGRRQQGATHEVASFESVDQAIAAYFRNINTHPVYAPVRAIRLQARSSDQPINGLEMAAGLERYSERGEVYIDEVREMIRFNDLESGSG